MTFAPGTQIRRYRIVSALGAGGMGVVYKAEDSRLSRQVALKFLPDALAADRAALDRFAREARAVSSLNHPHICTIYDINEWEGRPFLVLECLEGETLDARRGRVHDAREVVKLALQVAKALAAAHEKGIIHRDVKPANIFMTKDGTAKLLDFGIAKLAAQWQAAGVMGRPTEALTETGVMIGTAEYMSPEQVRGETVDARSDLFSLGVVLYEMATGRAPFGGSTPGAVVGEILMKTPTAPMRLRPELPSALDGTITRLLEKSPEHRYQSASEVRAELERIGSELRRPAAPEHASIVVLPFHNLSPDPDNAYFADGLTEEIIADLSKIRALRVISRTSAMRYRGTNKSLPEIAAELKVRHVLEGSVRKAGSALRITAQLIDAVSDTHLWAEKYSGTLDDVFDLQEQLSRSIVEALKGTLSREDEQRLAVRASSDPRAYDVWLRARHHGWTLSEEGVERAIRLVADGMQTLGASALLLAADAVLHYYAYDFGFAHSEETLARMEASADRAMELDRELALAWYARGLVHYKRGNLPEFVRYLRRAVDVERNSDALFFLGFVLAEAGLLAEARSYADEARERDPLMWMTTFGQSVVDLFSGDFETAVARCREWASQEGPEPAFALWWLGQALAYSGREDEARATFERAVRSGSGLLPDLCELGRRAFEGDLQGTRHWLESNPAVRHGAMSDETFPRYLATCFARVGDFDSALNWLEQAIIWGFTNHQFLSTDRYLAPLHHDARFQALMDKARRRQLMFRR
jgi:eukaryotic-like serine/threonine-protein kinase